MVLEAIDLMIGTATITPRGIYFNRHLYSCSLAVKEQWFKMESTGSFKAAIGYCPNNEDVILLLHKSLQPVIANKLLGLPDFTSESAQEYYLKMQKIKSIRNQRMARKR